MRNLNHFVTVLVAICLLLGFTDLAISQGGQQEKGGSSGSKGEGQAESEHEKIHGVAFGDQSKADLVFNSISKAFSVDKDTIKKFYDYELELKKGPKEIGPALRNAAKFVILARYRADKLIKEGKFTEAQDKEAVKQSIYYLWNKKYKEDAEVEELANESGIGISKLGLLMKAVFAGYYVDDVELANMQKQGVPLKDAVKIYALSRYRADKFVKEGKIPKAQENKAIKENVKHFLDKKKEGAKLDDLAKEIAGLDAREFNYLAEIIVIQKSSG